MSRTVSIHKLTWEYDVNQIDDVDLNCDLIPTAVLIDIIDYGYLFDMLQRLDSSVLKMGVVTSINKDTISTWIANIDAKDYLVYSDGDKIHKEVIAQLESLLNGMDDKYQYTALLNP